MAMTIHSPYSGRPIRIRDQDVGRALRDEEGRIFYAVPASDGNGYYAAPTRKGSEKDEQRYRELLEKGEQARASGAQQSAAQIHDARGQGRSNPVRRFITLIVLLMVVAALAYVLVLKTGNAPAWLPDYFNLNAPTAPPNTPPTAPDADTPPAIDVPDASQTQATPDVAATNGEPSSDNTPTATTTAANDANATAAGSAVMQTNNQSTADDEPTATWSTTDEGHRYRIVKPGDGRKAKPGDYVMIDYTAVPAGAGEDVLSAALFGDPVSFVLATGNHLQGWDGALTGMRGGETRDVLLPASRNRPGSAQAITQAGGDSANVSAGLLCRVRMLLIQPGVTIETTKAGLGREAKRGDVVTLQYQAFIADRDQPVLRSQDLGGPLRFRVGGGEVIIGLDLGVRGMREGESRTVSIPPYLGYGSRGAGGGLIPADAKLRYELTLIGVDRAEPASQPDDGRNKSGDRQPLHKGTGHPSQQSNDTIDGAGERV